MFTKEELNFLKQYFDIERTKDGTEFSAEFVYEDFSDSFRGTFQCMDDILNFEKRLDPEQEVISDILDGYIRQDILKFLELAQVKKNTFVEIKEKYRALKKG